VRILAVYQLHVARGTRTARGGKEVARVSQPVESGYPRGERGGGVGPSE